MRAATTQRLGHVGQRAGDLLRRSEIFIAPLRTRGVALQTSHLIGASPNQFSPYQSTFYAPAADDASVRLCGDWADYALRP